MRQDGRHRSEQSRRLYRKIVRWLFAAAACAFAVVASSANVPLAVRYPSGTAIALLAASDGNFYGPGFKLTPDGVFTQFGPYTGSGPLIPGSDGNFYGTESCFVFKLTPAGAGTILHNLDCASYPSTASLVEGSDGAFYGTTSDKGPSGGGIVYRVTADGASFTTLFAFGLGPGPDGSRPAAGLVLGSDGNFYGTTQYGGTFNAGTVFRMTPAGSLTTLHSFYTGSLPTAPLIETSPGVFLGTASSGDIYQITSAGAYSIVHSLDASAGEGATPVAPLVKASDGNYYGTTRLYQDPTTKVISSTVFRVTPSGAFSVVYTFTDSGIAGYIIDAGLTPSPDGNLYGGTTVGGAFTYREGTIFKLYLNPPPVPTVTLSAKPASVTRGNPSTLSWGSTDTGSCAASGAWSGAEPVAGSQAVTPATDGNIAYTLSCTGPGGTASKTATITVIPPPPTVTIGVSPAGINLGQSSTLTWSSTDATSCTASGAWSGTQATSGRITLAPVSGGSYTYALNCTGQSGNASGSATLTVSAPPTVNISVSPTTINLGNSATLNWTTVNAVTCIASGSWNGTKAVNGSQTVAPGSAGTFIYTLTCYNSGGQQPASVALTVQSGSSGGASSSGGSASSGGTSGGGGGGGGAAGFGLLAGLSLFALARGRKRRLPGQGQECSSGLPELR